MNYIKWRLAGSVIAFHLCLANAGAQVEHENLISDGLLKKIYKTEKQQKNAVVDSSLFKEILAFELEAAAIEGRAIKLKDKVELLDCIVDMKVKSALQKQYDEILFQISEGCPKICPQLFLENTPFAHCMLISEAKIALKQLQFRIDSYPESCDHRNNGD